MQAHERLEREWAEFNGLDPASMVACSSGTAALHLALEAMRLPPGSEVLVPDYAMIACPRAVTLAGLKSVFVDCDERLLMDQKLLGLLVGDYPTATCSKVSAILAVHIYGRRVPMSLLLDCCVGAAPAIVEDLAEAHGVRPHLLTDAACWSFQRTKIVAGEEGGAVWFKDREHANLARRLRSLGFDHRPPAKEGAVSFHDYRHVPRGHNYRLANLLAEPILDSLKWYKANSQFRRLAESWYDELCPDSWQQPPRDAVWVYDVRIPGLVNQEAAVRLLNAEGVAARCGFRPCSEQEEFLGCRVVGSGRAAVASREVVCLPVSPGRTTPEAVRRSFDILSQSIQVKISHKDDISIE